MLFSEYVKAWLLQEKMLAKITTYANYTQKMYTHILPYFGQIELGEIDRKTVQAFVFDMLSRKPMKVGLESYSVRFVKDLVVTLKTALNDAAREELIPRKVFEIKYPRDLRTKEVPTFTKEQQKKIVEGIYKEIEIPPRNFRNKNILIGIAISLYTGLRIGEVCGLKLSDIDFKRKELSVNRTVFVAGVRDEKGITKDVCSIQTPKTVHSIRCVPISKSLMDILKLIKPRSKNKQDFFITSGKEKPQSPRDLRVAYKSFLMRQGIPYIKFHALRHTFATRCIEAGIDPKTVSSILGHATPAITLSIYCHPAENLRRKCVEAFAKF